MNRSIIDIWVGAFVALGFAGLLFLALKVGNLASFSTAEIYQVQAKFANIGGLKVRAPIKSAGVVVGHRTSNNVRVLLPQANGSITSVELVKPEQTIGNGVFKRLGNAPYFVTTGDFDGDGNDDIAVASQNAKLHATPD